MRRVPSRLNTGRQLMASKAFAREHTRQLHCERLTDDSINVQDGGMSCQTRPNGRDGVVARPINQLAQGLPVWLALQLVGSRLCAGGDEGLQRRMLPPVNIDTA